MNNKHGQSWNCRGTLKEAKLVRLWFPQQVCIEPIIILMFFVEDIPGVASSPQKTSEPRQK